MSALLKVDGTPITCGRCAYEVGFWWGGGKVPMAHAPGCEEWKPVLTPSTCKPMESFPKAGAKVVTHLGMKGWMTGTVYNAEVTPGVQVRIWGVEANHVNGPQTFDRVFKVGDVVEHGSYNLHYTGPILALGAKTVTVKDDCGSGKNKRMNLTNFCWRNWNLDLVKIAKRNGEWMD
jgi:hypothetical protein